MSEPTIPDDDRQGRLEEAIAEYLIAADAGRAPEAEAFLTRYPDLRAELAELLADLSALAGLGEPLRPAGTVPRGSGSAFEPEPTLPHSDVSTTSGATTIGRGATIASDPSTGADSTTDPAATTMVGQGTNGADASVSLPGDTCVRYFGEYELIRELGRGGMGVVYKARQLSLNRLVALKMIRSAALASDDEIRRFQNEAEAVAMLDHPHIVPILEVGSHDGQRYFTMRLIGGFSLDEKLADYFADPRSAAGLVMQVSEAVHHAHQRGILHRDLKPANILLDERGEPYVTDFGLAKRAQGNSELTLSGAIMGTPTYMAPEQASGRRGAVTTSSDVYGLGAILYAVLTGHAPFGGDSVEEILRRVRESTPSLPSKNNPRVPRDLEIICLKCLEKDARRRYGSALAVADDLRDWLNSRPIKARPVGAPERFWLWCKRRPALAGLATAFLLALVGGIVVSTLFAIQARNESVRANTVADQARKESARANTAARDAWMATQKERNHVEDLRYIAEMNLVQRDFDASNLREMRRRLAEFQTPTQGQRDRRGFEWYYFAGLAHSELRLLSGHRGEINSVAFAPDGRRLATAGADGTARIWDAISGREMIATAGTDGKITSYDPNTSREIATPGHKGQVNGVAFAPDGRLLATGGDDGTTRIWDIHSGREVRALRGHQGRVSGVAFAPDGPLLATAGADGTARIWDIHSGREVRAFRGHKGQINGVVFAPDGRRLATAGADGTARIWDIDTGREIATFRGHFRGHGSWVGTMVHLPDRRRRGVSAVTFAPDGRLLAIGGDDGTAWIWDVDSDRELGALHGHEGAVNAVAFAPDGRLLATGGADGAARIWDIRSGHEVHTLRGHEGAVSGIRFAPDGRRLATAGADGTARTWDAGMERQFTILRGHRGVVNSVAFAAEGRRLATGGADGAARIWDIHSGREILALRGHEGVVSGLAFAPDGRRLASAGADGTVRIWDINTGREVRALRGQEGMVSGVAFAPDGRRLATASHFFGLKIWDPDTGREIADLRLRDPAIATDGLRFVDTVFYNMRIWELDKNGKPVVSQELKKRREHTVLGGLEDWGRVMAFDGRHIVTANPDGNVRIWDADIEGKFTPLGSQDDTLQCAAFAPDGRRLASAGDDGVVRLWDTGTGLQIARLRGHEGRVNGMAFAPDGRLLATTGDDGTARIWDASDSIPALLERREAVGMIRFWIEEAGSEIELRQRIERDATVSDNVRSIALNEVPGLWQTHLRQRAERLVEPLFERSMIRDDVVAMIREDPTIGPDLRPVALSLAESWQESSYRMGWAAWEVVEHPNAPAGVYRRAFRLAQRAARLAPENLFIRRALGAAQYRTQQYREALETLTRLNTEALETLTRLRTRRNTLIPGNDLETLAFLAMTQHRLGQRDSARETMDMFSALVHKLTAPSHDRSLLLRSEAEAVVLYDPIFPADPFAN